MLHELCTSDLSGINIKAFLSMLQSEQPDDFNYVINLRDEQRYTALHTAIFSRNIEAVKVLVEFGEIDIDAKCHGVPPLHLAVSTAIQPGGQGFGYDCFDFLLKNNANISLRDDRGFSIIHLAAEYNLPNFLDNVLKYAENAADLVNVTSKLQGFSPLHRAASTDADLTATILIKHGANIFAKTSNMNMSALHIAGEMGSIKVWRVLINCIDKDKASSLVNNEKDNLGRSPREFAEKSGWLLNDNNYASLIPGEIFENLFGIESSKTTIITNPFCIRHHTCPPSQLKSSSAPPENIKRIQVLVDDVNGVLNGTDLSENLSWIKNSKFAALSDVLRVHEWTYVRKVQEYCASISSTDPEEESGFVQLDGDTAISKDSYTAALAAAGSVCQGVDEVMNKHSRNVFCAVRPPGHHAGPKGVVKGKDGGPDSHGFCILNNVSIGASYAMNRYRDDIHRVAIVDFDVHHGNGTEETVRWLKPDIVEHDFSKCSSSDLFGVFYSTKYKPWFSEKDSENVLFVSVHGYGPRERGLESMMPQAAFYPGSGKTSLPKIPPSPRYKPSYDTPINMFEGEKTVESCSEKLIETLQESKSVEEEDNDTSDDDDILSEQNYSISQIILDNSLSKQIQNKKRMFSSFATNLVDTYESNVSIPPLILDIGVELPDTLLPNWDELHKAGGKILSELSYRIQWRKYFREEIFPRLIAFQPDFIFISAGFDAHKKDTINGGYIALVEEDFEWVTQCLVYIANSCCNGRIVSVLEGGYQLGGEYCSAFAQSAKAHVRSLTQGAARSRAPFSIAESQAETTFELNHLNSLKELRQTQIQRNEQRKQAIVSQRQKEYEASVVSNSTILVEQQQQGDITVQPITDDSILTAVMKANEVSNEDSLNKKRRRQQIDYAALDKELRENT